MILIRNLAGAKKMYSTNRREFKEVSIRVPWGHAAGKWWEPYDERPILSVHGWQDNCNSFARLIPRLNKNVGFLAIDLPGHGLSSRLPNGMKYHFTNYLVAIRSIVKYFDWPKTSLMGHSLGGLICYSYSMLYPESVDMLLCLEGGKPIIRDNAIDYRAKNIDAFLKNNSYVDSPDEPPSYNLEDMEKMLAAQNNKSVSLDYASILLERNIAPSKVHPGKYYFTRDPRLRTNASMPFSQDELIKSAHHMTMPIFIIKAEGSSYWEKKEYFFEVLDVLKKSSLDCDFHFVPGTHHLHLNQPEHIENFMVNFIRRHNVENRSKGGITDAIFNMENIQK